MSQQNIQARIAAARAVKDTLPHITEEDALAAVDAIKAQGILRENEEWQFATSPGNHMNVLVNEQVDGATIVQCAWDVDTSSRCIGFGFLVLLTLCRDIAAASESPELTPRAILSVLAENATRTVREADDELSTESLERLTEED